MLERRPLPKSIGGLTSTALRAYGRRFGLYVAVALAGLIVEGIASLVRPNDPGLLQAGSIVVDSAIAAFVSIGVAADVRDGGSMTNRAVASHALERWGLVAAVTTLVTLVAFTTSSAVFGSPQDTVYGLLTLPVAIAWGTLVFATVVAAVDTTTPAGLLVLGSLGRSITVSLARPNLGRLLVLSAVALLPAVAEYALANVLEHRHVTDWQFIGNIPIDALAAGPLQAVFTVFFLDFERRMGTRTRR